MSMNLDFDRRKLIIIVVVVILLLAAIVGGWWYWQRAVSQPAEPTVKEPAPATSLPPSKPVSAPVRTEEEIRKETISRLARMFTERFGTFSSQSQYEGIGDIMAVTTDSFQNWLRDKYIPELKGEHSASAYSGQTTRVMSVTVEKVTDNESQVAVRVQQAVTGEVGTIEVKYPVLKVALVRQNSMWLVDSAYWEKTP